MVIYSEYFFLSFVQSYFVFLPKFRGEFKESIFCFQTKYKAKYKLISLASQKQ